MDDLNIFLCSVTSSAIPNNERITHSSKKRLSCFATDSVLIKAKVTYSLALCMFAIILFMDQNFSGHVRCPWVDFGSGMK